jgi:SAM-dependent methyltransferase
MSDTSETISRYSTGDLRERLHAALRAAGKEPAVLKPTDLGEADHFHTGGRAATEYVARAVGIGLGTRVLDVGSGLGGPARYFASLGAVVTGVDVTAEFVELATELNNACGMGGSITMHRKPAQHTGLPAASFDAAVLMHVGMNLGDKAGVFAEIHRLLRHGGTLGIYDLLGTNELSYPMPWADRAETSHVETTADYERYLRAAGFLVTEDTDRSAEVLQVIREHGQFNPMNPDQLATPMILGDEVAARMDHVVAAIGAGHLAPRLIIAVKPV